MLLPDQGVESLQETLWLIGLAVVVLSFRTSEALGRLLAQSVKCPTLAQVMILGLMSSSSVSGSVLTAQSLEPASDSGSPSITAPPLLALSLSKTK